MCSTQVVQNAGWMCGQFGNGWHTDPRWTWCASRPQRVSSAAMQPAPCCQSLRRVSIVAQRDQQCKADWLLGSAYSAWHSEDNCSKLRWMARIVMSRFSSSCIFKGQEVGFAMAASARAQNRLCAEDPCPAGISRSRDRISLSFHYMQAHLFLLCDFAFEHLHALGIVCC